MTTKNICIFGDSIAYGEWSRDGGWADRLRIKLQRETIDSGYARYYFLYNASIPGNTSDDARARFPIEADAREPHIIIFAIGINDASRRGAKEQPRVPKEKLKQNMKTLFEDAKKRAGTVLCVGLTRVDESRTTPFETTYFENAQIAEYDTLLKEAAQAAGIPYLDTSRALAPEDLEDGLHPNDQGHEKLFSSAYAFLKGALNE